MMKKKEVASGGNHSHNAGVGFSGAWMTDIDDTIVPSGVTPDDEWIQWFSEKLRILKRNGIMWVPMSGVAIDKLAPRILDRLPYDVRSIIIYYAGDGSQKYRYDSDAGVWSEDTSYRRVFSDAQTLAIIGPESFLQVCEGDSGEPILRRDRARDELERGGFHSPDGIIGEMKETLSSYGYNPSDAETYFRGGSVSWMMLGDVSAEPYSEEKAVRARKDLIEYAESRLSEVDHLRRFGPETVHIPFHGSRGIKFVLRHNDKERGTRDLIEKHGLSSDSILFTGNELVEGGNDNVIRRIEGITLVSVGHLTDPGDDVIEFGNGIEAHDTLMTSICAALKRGESWPELLKRLRSEKQSFL